jgi:hypothetical protein
MNSGILLGSVAQTLQANGYAPTSAIRPGKFGFRFSEDPAAVLTAPQRKSECGLDDFDKRRVLALTVTTRDPALRKAIVAILAKYGVGKGPVRVGSDGSETHVLQSDTAHAPLSKDNLPSAFGEIEPAAALDSVSGEISESAFIPLSGTWKNGDLITVPRAKLPIVENIDALFQEIYQAIGAAEPESAYQPPKLSPEMEAAIKRNKLEREKLIKRHDACTDPDILSIVEKRRGQRRLGEQAFQELQGDARMRQTVELYEAIEAELQPQRDLVAARRKLGIGV